MGVRTSYAKLLAATSLSGSARVGFFKPLLAIARKGPIRVSDFQLIIASSPAQQLVPTLLGSDSEIFAGFKYIVGQASATPPESNPYRPQIPDQLIKLGSDYYDFTGENQQILRQQHDITQAGDSTFPYEMTIKASDIKHFKLGSVGRFFHADYGIIQARYVQFDKMVAVGTPSCPVGLFKNRDGLDWVVTNDLTQSDPNLVVGIAAPWSLPDNESYGWAIVNGPILQPIRNNSTSQSLGEPFSWDSSGAVSNAASGKIIGRRVNKTTITRLVAGTMLVQLESLSPADIRGIIDTHIASLNALVTTLQNQIAALQVSSSASAILSIKNSIKVLTAQVAQESSVRSTTTDGIQSQFLNLDAVSVAQLTTALKSLQFYVDGQIAELTVEINDAAATAIQALNLANSITVTELSSLQTQITTLQTLLITLNNRAKGKFPVVDGAVPPNLVYLDDGSLVYTETF